MLSIFKKIITRKMTMGQAINYLKFKYFSKSPVLRYGPIELSIQTTNRCTFQCDMCQTHSPKIPKNIYHYQGGKDIDLQTFKQFVDKFKNALSVSLIGTGEPLLNKDFFEMINYAAFKRKMSVVTVSNGSIMGNKINDILNSGLYSIEISLNGHNAEEFNRMTGQPKERFLVIHKNIQRLIIKRDKRGSKLRVSLSFILDQQNYKNIFQMMKIAKKLGVDEVSFHNFLPSPVPGFTARERSLYSDNLNAITALKKLKEKNYKIKINFPRLLDKERKEKYCRDYFTVLRVDGKGDIGGCTGQLLNLAGNGKFYDENVWNNSHFRERRKLFLNPNVLDLAPCQNCPCNNKPLKL